jgi:5-methylcytosine-specific restriction protein B
MNSIQDLRQYLTSINTGDETAGLGDSGGYVNFSNSGRRGKKEFTLSLASILRGFEDIEKNIAAFAKGQNYVEATWRELGEKFEDGPLCAMIQVQTKPVFILFSKIIFWANNKNQSDFNTEKIEITSSSIQTTIKKLTQLISDFSPSATNPSVMAKIAASKNLNEIVKQLLASTNKAELTFSENQIKRFIAAQNTKPFVILTGLSGSGKTKLAEAVAYWMSEDTKTQVCMVAVGADWTNNEPLLGYADAINKTQYCAPSSGVLQLLTHAIEHEDKPHFLILDEMNLSHVERYFADFLSAMESSKPKLRLHGNNDVDLEASEMLKVPAALTLPPNVFIIGTVNVDETTYMFSPKVLDRANVIEFRVSTEQMTAFLAAPAASVNMEDLKGEGAHYAEAFVARAQLDAPLDATVMTQLQQDLMELFELLAEVGAEFGYRSAKEIARFVAIHRELSGDNWNYKDALDAQVMQKLMPKLHGSARKLTGVLNTLEKFALEHNLPLTQDKVKRMQKRLKDEGFTSFAEN